MIDNVRARGVPRAVAEPLLAVIALDHRGCRMDPTVFARPVWEVLLIHGRRAGNVALCALQIILRFIEIQLAEIRCGLTHSIVVVSLFEVDP